MNVFEETMTLNNGVAIPRLALGTWLIDDAAVADAVKAAAAIGYRHIDTAQAYGNERGVGEGIRGCGVPREKIFVTTKVAAEHKTYDAAAASIDASLSATGLDYLDMVIIHSPQPWAAVNQSEDRYYEGNREAWRALEDALSAGKVRAIGVSNFNEGDIDNILGVCRVKPAVNQVLAHIANTPKALIDRCQAQGIAVEAYSPVAHGEAMKRPEIAAMADKYGVSVPQLCIRYDWQLGLIVLPKTANPDHMRDNAAIDFAISDADMQTLLGLETMTDYGDAGFFPVFGGRL
ncbi:aldo/keto reductase [Pseudoramibacter alactolyticus]|uniref:aldo/keto reductase n=1 Tax=Pseudoramibacter alactolyticus TaxID=113287 RepID=UPI002355EF11|nr:aldo/keto reductase [Pseudoramibacter alactolyticus]MBM6968134.1 aldo/keto reductase [Pseudoramibacter alactolyticus]